MPRQDVTSENTGFFRKNQFKKPDDKTPDFRGDCNIDGKQLEMAGWIQTGSDGKNYLSLRFQVPRDQSPPPADPVTNDGFAGF